MKNERKVTSNIEHIRQKNEEKSFPPPTHLKSFAVSSYQKQLPSFLPHKARRRRRRQVSPIDFFLSSFTLYTVYMYSIHVYSSCVPVYLHRAASHMYVQTWQTEVRSARTTFIVPWVTSFVSCQSTAGENASTARYNQYRRQAARPYCGVSFKLSGARAPPKHNGRQQGPRCHVRTRTLSVLNDVHTYTHTYVCGIRGIRSVHTHTYVWVCVHYVYRKSYDNSYIHVRAQLRAGAMPKA